MALINGLYVFVQRENMSYGVEVTEHIVETGIEISDHVKRKAIVLSISGEIVGKNAASVLNKLKQMHQTGVIATYSGRTILNNCLITDFSTNHSHNIWGGCEFSMVLKEIRTASTSYKKPANDTNATSTQQVEENSKEENVYHTVKRGDCVWNLVAASNAPYKKYGLTCDQVMELNPKAFSRPGDFGTLKVGAKIIVGKR